MKGATNTWTLASALLCNLLQCTHKGRPPGFGPVENGFIVAEYTLTDDDIRMIGDVRNLVRTEPDKFCDAGKWLDHNHSFIRRAARDRRFYRKNNALDHFDAERWQSKNLRLRVAVTDLLEVAQANAILLPTVDTAYRVLLICWLLTDPEADDFKPELTKFQDWSVGEASHDLMQLCSDTVIPAWERWWVLCRRSWQVVQPGKASVVVEIRQVMTDGQKRLWDALDGRALAAKELAAESELDTSEDTVRQYVLDLRKAGRKIGHRPGRGYFRPNAPPAESVPTKATRVT